MTRKKPMAKNKDVYINYEKDANPDHRSMLRDKPFDVDKDIEEFRRLDPKDVFQNYKAITKKKPKKEGSKSGQASKKIRTMPKGTTSKRATIKYGM